MENLEDDLKREENFGDRWCNRVIDYYILSFTVTIVFCILVFGPIANWFDTKIKNPLKNTITKALLIFLTTYAVDRLLTLSCDECDISKRRIQKQRLDNMLKNKIDK